MAQDHSSDHNHHHHHHGDDGDGHGHHHGHENDRGWSGAVRYLRHAPDMWSSEINDAVLAALAPADGELVVDIGAGMGAGSMLASKRGATVLAVEPTPFLRRILQARARFDRSSGSVAVLDGAAEHLPVADASVDALWAVNSMHHWVDAEAAVVEIARVLRPAGRILLLDEDFGDPTHPDYERFGGDDAHKGPEHHGFSMVDVERIGGYFRDAGLASVRAEKRRFADRPALVVETA